MPMNITLSFVGVVWKEYINHLNILQLLRQTCHTFNVYITKAFLQLELN